MEDDAKIAGCRRVEDQKGTRPEKTLYGARIWEPEGARSGGQRADVRADGVNGRQTVADRRAVGDAGDAEIDWRRSRLGSGREASRQQLDYGRTMCGSGPIVRYFSLLFSLCIAVREVFCSPYRLSQGGQLSARFARQ